MIPKFLKVLLNIFFSRHFYALPRQLINFIQKLIIIINRKLIFILIFYSKIGYCINRKLIIKLKYLGT